MNAPLAVNTINTVCLANNNVAFHDSLFFAASEIGEHKPNTHPERSTFYGIGLCTQGEAVLNANLITYQIRPGTLITISPYTIFYWETMSPDYKVIKIFFEEMLLHSFLFDKHLINKLSIFKSGEAGVCKIKPENVDYYTVLFSSVINKLKTHRENETIVSSNLIMLLSELDHYVSCQQENIITSASGVSNIKLELVCRFKQAVTKEFLCNRSVKKYAASLFVSPSYLGEVVKEVTGKTPTHLIEEMILMEAKLLLRKTDYSISQITDKLDYYDVSFFCKFFKSHTGYTPTDFRNLPT